MTKDQWKAIFSLLFVILLDILLIIWVRMYV